MAKKIVKKVSKRLTKSEEAAHKAARDAAREAIEEIQEEELEEEFPDQADMTLADSEFGELSDVAVMERDVFVDAFKKAQSKGDVPRYYIYKDSNFTSVRMHPYSWEKLQEEYGVGLYRIVAKSIKTGQNIMSQTELVGDPNTMADKLRESHDEPVQNNGPTSPFELMTFMSQIADKAEAKAMAAANSQSNSTATMMQSMMMMFMESSKQSQAAAQAASQQQMNLLTTLLSSGMGKSDKPTGPTALEMIKMISEAEKRSEDRTSKFYELVERKAEALADRQAEEAPEAKEESWTQSLVKGFIPMIAQSMAGAAAGAPAPGAQVPLTQDQQNQLQFQQNQAIQQQQLAHDVAQDKIMKERARRMALGAQKVPATFVEGKSQPGTGATSAGQPGVQNVAPTSQVVRAPSRTEIKAGVIQFIGRAGVVQDITGAVLSGETASNCAESVLRKLESSGLPRQTVAESLTLQDLTDLALANGLPKEALSAAQPWIGEFFEYIQSGPTKAFAKTAVSLPTNGTVTTAAALSSPAPLANGSAAPKPVKEPTRARTGTRTPEPSKNP